jgi:hypothetical protein
LTDTGSKYHLPTDSSTMIVGHSEVAIHPSTVEPVLD